MFVAKYHGMIITKIEKDGHCIHHKLPETVTSMDGIPQFADMEDAKQKIGYFFPDIKLVKADTFRKYIEARFIITSNWLTPYIVRKAGHCIKTTGNPQYAKRFNTRNEAEKYMRNLHPAKNLNVTLAVTEREVF